MEGICCPVCGGDPVPLGQLGPLVWCRCRNCGMDFNFTPDEVDDEGDDDEGDEA